MNKRARLRLISREVAVATIMVVLFLCLVSFIWLELHNQYETEHLIYFDYWRSFSDLQRGQEIYPFVYRNVHPFAMSSLLWYLDVLFAKGTLRFLHAYVAALTALSFSSLLLIMLQTNDPEVEPTQYVVLRAMAAAAIWLSPSIAQIFTYPSLDLMAASVLFLCLVAATITSRVAIWWRVLYFVTAFLGFWTTEAFLFVPITLAADAAIRRRREHAIADLIFVFFLICLYFLFLQHIFQDFRPDMRRSLPVIAANFLVILSTHFHVLCLALGMSAITATKLSILLSAIQLACFCLFIARPYAFPSRMQIFVRFSICLGIYGIGSVALATWLRAGQELLYSPVSRYVGYTVMFSVALFLIGSSAQFRKMNRICLVASITVIAINATYILAEAGVMLLRAHNTGQMQTRLRLEMPVYALEPGNELDIGPVEPNGGGDYRARVHNYLEERKLSVFASAGYQTVGTVFAPPKQTGGLACVRQEQTDSPRPHVEYLYIYFKGVDDNGVFLQLDKQNKVLSFSFAQKATPFERTTVALLPAQTSPTSIYFVRFRNGAPIMAVRCQ